MSLENRPLRIATKLSPDGVWLFDRRIYPLLLSNEEHQYYNSTLTTTSVTEVTLTLPTDDENQAKIYGGLAYEIVGSFCALANTTCTLTAYYDVPWGNNASNGTWFGMLGRLMRGEIDMLAADFEANDDRANDFSFASPIKVEQRYAVIRTEFSVQNTIDYFVLIKPFRRNVWLILMAVLFSVAILSTFLQISEAKITASMREESSRLNFKSFCNIFYRHTELLIILLCERDTNYEPSQRGARLLIAFWALFCAIFMTLYPAQMFSVLTIPPPRRPPFNDFVTMQKAGYKLFGSLGSSTEGFMSTLLAQTTPYTADGIALRQVLMDKSEWSASNFDPPEARIIRSVDAKISAIFREVYLMQKQTAACELTGIPLTYERGGGGGGMPGGGNAAEKALLPQSYNGFVMRKNDGQLQRAFALHYARMRQTGLLDIWLNRRAGMWLNVISGRGQAADFCDNVFQEGSSASRDTRSATDKNENESDRKIQLNIKQLAAAFILLIMGFALAFIVYCVEILSYRAF